MIIYKAENKINGKIYIGQTSKSLDKRISEHLGKVYYKSIFNQALKKYGLENFELETIAWCYTKEHSDFLEKFYIQYFNSKVPNGYNLTNGGGSDVGFNQPEESNKKRSESLKKVVHTLEWSKKISESKLGKKTNYPKGRRLGEKNSFYGKHHTEETKEILRKANLGKTMPEETKKNWSLNRRGQNNSNYRHGGYCK